jgi:hypothetical protein
MLARAALLMLGVLIGEGWAQSPPAVSDPRDYKTSLVKYAVVDRPDGLSRDLYVSRDAIEALKRDPRLRELPAGALFALDVHSAKARGRDPKTHAPIFEATPEGRLVRSKDERTLHLMRKIQPGFGSQNWTFGGFDPLTERSPHKRCRARPRPGRRRRGAPLDNKTRTRTCRTSPGARAQSTLSPAGHSALWRRCFERFHARKTEVN